MNNRIHAYCEALEFIRKNPFEKSVDGLDLRDVLTLIQNYLDQHAPDQKINLLRYSDLLSSGKNILTDSLHFSTQITLALNYLAPLLNAPPEQTGISFSNATVPTPIINNLVETWEAEVVKNFKDNPPTGRRAFWRASTARGGVLRRNRWENLGIKPSENEEGVYRAGDLLSRELLRTRSLQVNEELRKERENRIKEIQTKLGTEFSEKLALTTVGQTAEYLADVTKIHKIIVDAVDLSEDINEEQKYWEDSSLSLYRPLERKSIGSLSPEQREQKLREVYAKKVQDRLTDEHDPLSQNTNLIKQVVGLIPGNYLTEQSSLKVVDKKIPKIDPNKPLIEQIPNPLKVREEVGALLFGKLTFEAERATQGVALKLKDRQQRIGDAVAETYFELQAKGLNVANMSPQEINAILYDKLHQKLRMPVSRSAEFDVSQEAKQISVFEAQVMAARGDTEELHSLPIPGIIFLDKLARTTIVGDTTIYNALKTRTVDEVLHNFPQLKLQELEAKLRQGKKLSQYEDYLYKTLPLASSSEAAFFNLFNLQTTTGEPEKISKEEVLLVRKYLEGYQQILQKHKTIGWLANLNAKLYSMQNLRIRRFEIPIPRVQAWGYFRYFLSLSFSDPTIAPLAGVMLSWSLVKGTIGFSIKTKYYIRAVDKVFSIIPGLKHVGFLKNLFYVKEYGMSVVTWLHPIHATRVLFKESGKKILQKSLNKSVQWGTRILGKEAMDKILARLAASALGRLIATGGIPIIGGILNLLGFLWDFIFPEWLKRIIKLVLGGIIIGLAWLIGLIIGLVGPLALVGLVVGLIFGGLPGLIIGGAIGFAVQTGLWIITGNVMWLPAWLHGIASGIGSVFTGIAQGIVNIAHGGGVVSAAATAMGTTTALAAVSGVGVAAAGGLVSVMMITTAVWTPLAPLAVPGGLVAQDFQVRKYVQAEPLASCEYKTVDDDVGSHPVTTKCKNDVAESGSNTSFVYTILIKARAGKTISNIQIEDKITVAAQGPTITTPPTVTKYDVPIPDLQPQVDGITLPDPATGKDTLEVKYTINFRDSKYQNSAVFNLVKVTANGQIASNGTVFTIGTPPPSDCPVKQGTINCASLGGSFAGCQHGSDSYWTEVGGRCSYNIPALTQTRGNSIAYPNATFCVAQQPLREDYGFAVDIGPRYQMVFFPTVYGESLSWIFVSEEQGNPTNNNPTYGWGGIFNATGKDYSYKMYMTHLEKNFSHRGQSGEIIGPMLANNPNGSHVHVELERKPNNSTQWETLRPEFLCSY